MYMDTTILSGKRVNDIAQVMRPNDTLDSEYNTKTLATSKIHVCNYSETKSTVGTLTEQTVVKRLTNDRSHGHEIYLNESLNYYTRGKYYLICDCKSSSNRSKPNEVLRYAINIPSGRNRTYTNVATILYEDGIRYNGEKYNLKMNIKKITVESCEADTMVLLDLGTRPWNDAYDDKINSNSYYPGGVIPGLTLSTGSQINVDIDYCIVDKYGNPVNVTGIWGITDLDGVSGMDINDFKATSNNTLIKEEGKTSGVTETLYYDYNSSKNSTLFFARHME